MSAAVVSTSVIGSAAMTIQRGRGSAAASARIWSRNVRALAKNNGASKRKITRPGICSASGCSSRSCWPARPGTAPSVVWYGHQARRNTLRIDRTTAMAMPSSTPSRATPRNAATESRHSTRRWRQSRTRPGMSASDSDAAMTTAASVGCGRLRSSPGTSTSMSTIAAAPTTPVSCVLAPACSATAVREPLVLTGKPWKNPAATLAAPMPIISPLPSTSWPVRAANADAVEMVSASATMAMPTRAGHQQRQVGRRVGHREAAGSPDGSVPTSDTPWSPRSRAPEAAIAITTATSTPGTRGSTRGADQDQRQADQADRDRGARPPCRRPGPRRSRAPRRSGHRRSTENPNSLGSWPIRMVSASPLM